jgi:hypothetical protein
MTQRMMRWARLPAAMLSALPLSALLLCPWPVQAQQARSALELLEGSWSDVYYDCKYPWRITVSGDTVKFELPFRRLSEIAYYTTDEKVVGTQDNATDTVTISMSSDDVVDVIGDRFTYTLEGSNKFVIHEHRNNVDYVHTRCEGKPVASQSGADVTSQRG